MSPSLAASLLLPERSPPARRYEATGDEALRAAAEAFWDELSKNHLFATGGSTTGEVWLRAGLLGDAVVHQRSGNYWAHDQAETCVAHNSMRVSRRLLQWSQWPAHGHGHEHHHAHALDQTTATMPAAEAAAAEAVAAATVGPGASTSLPADGGAASERVLRHAAYLERTLYNAVLGTQRGTLPGQMLYMFPLGSGVSKAGIPEAPQGHHWSDEEHHFWCCQGSGIEAFARLADHIFWRRDASGGGGGGGGASGGGGGGGGASGGGGGGGESGVSGTPPLLFVLQLLPSTLLWKAASVRVTISGDYPGAIGGGVPLRVVVSFERLGGASGGAAAAADAPLDVWLRVPQWASSLELSSRAGLGAPAASLAATTAGSLVALRLASQSNGSLSLAMTPQLSWERIKDSRPQFASLHAALYGPIVLGGFTYAERALPLGAALTPVPSSARSQLFSLRVHTAGGRASSDPNSHGAANGAPNGCLVKKWGHVWVVRPDRTRSFAPRPPAECLNRATPIEDGLADFPQAHGGGKGYSLDDAAIADACARLDGCVLPEGVSAFASGKLYLMHLGAESPAVLAAPPPLVTGTRRGGTDAANAASWRLTDSPVGLGSRPPPAVLAGAVYLESFDLPGHVLTPTSKPVGGGGEGAVGLELARVRPGDETQLWLRAGTDSTRMENAAKRGHFLSAARRKLPASVASPASSIASSGGSSAASKAAATAAPPAGLVVPHRGAAISREWELVLSPTKDAASAIEADASFADYAETSFWLTRPPLASEAEPPRTRPFLLMPLNEMQDEHYNVYWCKPSTAADAMKPPRHCV